MSSQKVMAASPLPAEGALCSPVSPHTPSSHSSIHQMQSIPELDLGASEGVTSPIFDSTVDSTEPVMTLHVPDPANPAMIDSLDDLDSVPCPGSGTDDDYGDYSGNPLLDPPVEEDSDAITDEVRFAKTDRFGFILKDDRQGYLTSAVLAREAKALPEWATVLQNWERHYWEPFARAKGRHQKKLKSLIRSGIPDHFRSDVWRRLLGISCEMSRYPTLFGDSCSLPLTARCQEDIIKDLDRTFPKNKEFKTREDMLAKLESVLHAYAAIDTECGYCQSMAFITALFLLYFDEQVAFHALNRFLNSQPWVIRELFISDFPLLFRMQFVFGKLVKKHLPRIIPALEAMHLDLLTISNSWFMTVFLYSFPFDFCVRVFDLVLSEGPKIIYRVALALMKVAEQQICTRDFATAMGYLQNELPLTANIDEVLDIAFSFSLSRDEIHRYELEYFVSQGSPTLDPVS